MLKAYKISIYFILSVLTIGLVHSGTTTASNLTHLENKSSSTQSNNACQPICHGSPAASRTKIVDVKKDEREPIPPLFGLDEAAPVASAESILSDRQIWKLASWTPPDRLLLSSAYTTSL
jgi:hypothetical protein